MTITLERKQPVYEDDFFMVDDFDPADETQLRHLVAAVESFAGGTGMGLRISVLNAEQWDQVIRRVMPVAQQRRAALHMHTIKDPRDSKHLLISPSAVGGVNEDSQVIYQEIIYSLLRCIGSPLNGPMRRGVDDVVAELCGHLLDRPIFARHYPQESALVRGIIKILIKDFGHDESDWALLLRQDPDKFFTVLRKSRFSVIWMAYLGEGIEDSDALTSAITNPRLDMNSEFIQHTKAEIVAYLDGEK